MLASPMLALAICSLISYGKQQSRLLLSLGFRATPMEWGKLVLSPTLEQKHVKYIDDNCSADNGGGSGLSALSPEVIYGRFGKEPLPDQLLMQSCIPFCFLSAHHVYGPSTKMYCTMCPYAQEEYKEPSIVKSLFALHSICFWSKELSSVVNHLKFNTSLLK
jgi:hypothetical protein